MPYAAELAAAVGSPHALDPSGSRPSFAGHVDQGLLPRGDELALIVGDGEDLEPAHGEGATCLEDRPERLEVIAGRGYDKLSLYSTVRTSEDAGIKVRAA